MAWRGEAAPLDERGLVKRLREREELGLSVGAATTATAGSSASHLQSSSGESMSHAVKDLLPVLRGDAARVTQR